MLPHTHTAEFSQLALSNDSGDGDTLGPLPGQPGGWGSSDGEFSVAYDYYQHKQPGQASNSSKSSSPSPGERFKATTKDDCQKLAINFLLPT